MGAEQCVSSQKSIQFYATFAQTERILCLWTYGIIEHISMKSDIASLQQEL
jgi:hypothetical protein